MQQKYKKEVNLQTMEQYYYDFGTWIRKQFPFRVQKISIDAGFTCPNRDGRIGVGGCIFCDNKSLLPILLLPYKEHNRTIGGWKTFLCKEISRHEILSLFPSIYKHVRCRGQAKKSFTKKL